MLICEATKITWLEGSCSRPPDASKDGIQNVIYFTVIHPRSSQGFFPINPTHHRNLAVLHSLRYLIDRSCHYRTPPALQYHHVNGHQTTRRHTRGHFASCSLHHPRFQYTTTKGDRLPGIGCRISLLTVLFSLVRSVLLRQSLPGFTQYLVRYCLLACLLPSCIAKPKDSTSVDNLKS